MYLVELTKAEIISIAKSDTPNRFKKRTKSRITAISDINTDVLKKGDLILSFSIKGETDNYEVQIRIDDYVSLLQEYFSKIRVMYKAIQQSLRYSMANKDIYVRCSCSDFKYRFAYTASKKGAISGNPQDIPALVTNPKNRGLICKHLSLVINNVRWIPAARSKIRQALVITRIIDNYPR